MGAYLSEPITKKISSDESGENVAFGASSMQGWRISQEDAHNCCIKFDDETSLFAVYDGHGGHEVATYCARELPNFIKNTEAYKSGDLRQSLIDAFLGFDSSLTKPEIIEVLKQIAGAHQKEKDDTPLSGDEDNVSDLRKDAAMPLEQVMARYYTEMSGQSAPLAPEVGDSNESSTSSPVGRHRRAREKAAGSGGAGCSSTSSSWKADVEQDAVSSSSQPTCVPVPSVPSDSTTSTNGVDEKRSESVEEKIAVVKSAELPDSSEDVKEPQNSNQISENSSQAGVNGGEETKENIGDADSSRSVNDSVSSSSSSGGMMENGEAEGVAAGCVRRIKPTMIRSVFQTGSTNQKIKAAERAKKQANDDDDEVEEINDECPVMRENDEDSEDENEYEYEVEDEESEEEDESSEDDDDDEDDEDSKPEGEEEEEDDGELTMDLTEEPGCDSGCTAVVAVLRKKDLYVANAGDSRCVLCRDGEALELSLDHKPEDEPEMSRIVKAGGKVTLDGRVNGGLNLSRALGDHAYKRNSALPPQEQMISALPDIRHISLEPGRDEFMILACDGIWNFMSSQEVIKFIRPRLAENSEKSNISKICEDLFDHCLAPDTTGDGTGCDNMTAVIVKFNWPASAKSTIDTDASKSAKKRTITESTSNSSNNDGGDGSDAGSSDPKKAAVSSNDSTIPDESTQSKTEMV